MSEQSYIAKYPELERSQDYAALRREGIAHIERLAHKLWTDYNIHDPGITLLELLCYAITDLGYRTAYPIEDLLTQEREGRIESLGDFHTARDILTCNPVSFRDLAKLLVDLPGVRNAWVEINREQQVCLDRTQGRLLHGQDERGTPQTLNGLYDIYIEYEERVMEQPEPHRTGLPRKWSGGGDYIAANRAGIRFDCLYPLRLESVAVYARTPGRLTVRLLDAAGDLLAEATHELTKAGKMSRLALGFPIPRGEGYRLEAQSSGLMLYRNRLLPAETGFPMGLERLITLQGGFTGNTRLNDIYYFFYDWVIRYDPVAGGAARLPNDVQLARKDVDQKIRDRLHACRNLCEEPVRLCRLVPEEVAVCADLELEPGANAEQVLTEIFVRLREHVSPPVHFHSLQEMLDRGYSSEEIFSGPALDHGFIDDEEFDGRRGRCEIRASDVTRILMDVEGVLAVRKLSLLAFEPGAEAPHASDAWLLTLSDERTRAPLFKWERSKIIFYQNGLPRYPDREQVASQLRERHEGDVRRRMRSAQERHDLPIPVGEDRALSDYYPAQNELPMTYRVGSYRVPASEPPLRHAQAKQLKAFLMFFEQLLANYLSQLQRMHELFSWKPGNRHTYFTQLVKGIHGLEEVYLEAYGDEALRHARLQHIIEDERTAADRRNRFLDHLLARFCEAFTDYSLLVYDRYESEVAASRIIDDKCAFLADYPRISRERGRAADYRFPELPAGPSGFQYRLYRLLGFPRPERRNLAGHEIEIAESGPDPERPWQFRLWLEGQGGARRTLMFESQGCANRESAEALLDRALQLAGDAANYREADGFHDLVILCGDGTPRRLGSTTADAGLEQVVAYFAALSEVRGFHLVESILLRPRSQGDPLLPVQLAGEEACPCHEVTDPYSFRINIILPSWPAEFQDSRFRAFVEGTLRRETPAHIFPRICWVSHGQMVEFEQAYRRWEEGLARITRGQPLCEPAPVSDELRAEYSARLEALIQILHRLNNVHPLARLYDCESARGEDPRVFLDHSNLGTY